MKIEDELELWEELADDIQEWEANWPSDGPDGYYLGEEIEKLSKDLVALGYSKETVDYYSQAFAQL